MNESLMSNARLYAAWHRLEIAEPLGSGKDGIVAVAKGKDKPANVAVNSICIRARLKYASQSVRSKPVWRAAS